MDKQIMVEFEKAIARLDEATILELQERSGSINMEKLIYEALMNAFHPIDSCRIKGCERCFRLLLKERDTFAMGMISTCGSRWVGAFNEPRLREVMTEMKEMRDKAR